MFYTPRLMIRAADPEADTATLMQWQNNEDFMWALRPDGPRPTPRSDVKKFVDKIGERSDGLPFLVVSERPRDLESPDQLGGHDDLFMKDGKPRYPLIGVFNFHSGGSFSWVNRDVSFGIAFDKFHQGAGYGTELLHWAMDYTFFTLGLHRCHLSVVADNKRAIKCYEKVGFVQEGVSRSCYLKDGVWKDIINMSLLEDEWRARRKERVQN